MATTDGTPQAQTETPNPSAPEGQTPSQEVKITKAEWDKVQSLLGRVENLQSERDIAKQTRGEVAKLRDDVLPLLERAHLLGSQSKPLNEALSQIQNEQTDAEFRQAVLKIAQSMGSGAQPTGTGTAQGVDMATVLADYQLDPKDPYVAGKLAGQTFTSKEQAELFAARIFKDKTLITTNPAQQSATTGAAVGAGGAQEMINRLSELQQNPFVNQKEIKELTTKLDAINWGGLT
jgi:hypothetical protein